MIQQYDKYLIFLVAYNSYSVIFCLLDSTVDMPTDMAGSFVWKIDSSHNVVKCIFWHSLITKIITIKHVNVKYKVSK